MVHIKQTNNHKRLGEINLELFGEGLGMDFSRGHNWVCVDRGKIVGFGSYRVVDGDTAFLSRAGVLPQYCGQGLQKRLIKVRVNHARKAGLTTAITYTMPDNAPSFSSLQSCGFRLYLPQNPWAGKDVLYWRLPLDAKG